MKALLGKRLTGVTQTDDTITLGFEDGSSCVIRAEVDWSAEEQYLSYHVVSGFDHVWEGNHVEED